MHCDLVAALQRHVGPGGHAPSSRPSAPPTRSSSRPGRGQGSSARRAAPVAARRVTVVVTGGESATRRVAARVIRTRACAVVGQSVGVGDGDVPVGVAPASPTRSASGSAWRVSVGSPVGVSVGLGVAQGSGSSAGPTARRSSCWWALTRRPTSVGSGGRGPSAGAADGGAAGPAPLPDPDGSRPSRSAGWRRALAGPSTADAPSPAALPAGRRRPRPPSATGSRSVVSGTPVAYASAQASTRST